MCVLYIQSVKIRECIVTRNNIILYIIGSMHTSWIFFIIVSFYLEVIVNSYKVSKILYGHSLIFLMSLHEIMKISHKISHKKTKIYQNLFEIISVIYIQIN